MTDQPQKNTSTGPKKTDWAAAYIYFLERHADGKLKTLQDVANHFNVNGGHVRTRAAREKWVEHRQALSKKATEKAESKYSKEVEKVMQIHLDTYRALRTLPLRIYNLYSEEMTDAEQAKKNHKAYKSLVPKPVNVDFLITSIERTIKGERLLMGLPTEISKSDINQTINKARCTDEEIAKADAAWRKIKK